MIKCQNCGSESEWAGGTWCRHCGALDPGRLLFVFISFVLSVFGSVLLFRWGLNSVGFTSFLGFFLFGIVALIALIALLFLIVGIQEDFKDTPALKAERKRRNDSQKTELGEIMGTITLEQLSELAEKGDVIAIEKAFQYSADWATRELAVTALKSMINWDVDYNIGSLKQALEGIIEVCKAETGGGSYRTNCLRVSSSLLKKIQ